mmetsp:Transcript_43367/g.98028  ORF Transcript_43367/g.98028 Transcript_43367/m.98028 type:complete len:92 (-) Transcript_43367:388-663(-)
MLSCASFRAPLFRLCHTLLFPLFPPDRLTVFCRRFSRAVSGVSGALTLLFEGVPVDDRVTLTDAGCRDRSTLTLTRLADQAARGDDGLPVY